MRLSDALDIDRIAIGMTAPDKETALRALIDLAVERGCIHVADVQVYADRVMEREALHSTALGHGIAVPHAQADGVDGVFCCLGILPSGVDYDSIDNEPAKIICLIVAQEGLDGLYLQLLSHISRLFARGDVRERVLSAGDPEAVLEAIRDAERSVTGRAARR
ncbi:PTS sugar transporter subunit IIA [Candidatus Poribacteria bacterium]|nr:PTS sugar transporter subunit IIA [Candidatus Poribacteria bacterium]